jgi:ADP-ribose pyrophosphatase
MDRPKTISEILAYQNKYLTLFDNVVQFPEELTKYLRATWTATHSVAILPETAEGDFVLVNQYSYATDRMLLQAPKGMGKPEDSSPMDTAQRELIEETGYAAREFELLKLVFAEPGLISNSVHVFLAKDAKKIQEPAREKTELFGSIELIPKSLFTSGRAFERISDAVTIAAINLASLHYL